DPLSALERDLALQLQIAKAARRLCREENIGKRLRKRRLTAALLEEQKLKDLENVLNQCRGLAGRRPLSAGPAAAEELSASDESSLSDTALLEEEETRPLGPATPRRSPCPEEPTQEGGSGPLLAPPSPWQETSLDGPYEKAKKPGGDPRDGETRGSRCYPGSPVVTLGVPDPAAPLAPRVGDVPPYRFVPIRTLVLCQQSGSSAPSTPEPSGRRGQSQSLRVEPCWQPGEMRGRSAVPRRRPTYYTVTPGYCPRGAPRLLPPAGPPVFLYEQDLAPLRYQRLVPSHSRIVRTPSLKDHAPGGGRGLSKAAVTEELKSWHQRARLRGGRPPSLARQGAFRG
ncbi:INAVA protein, partial [Aegotheles bennettii]|nr:INAVA protein [Aegotheles bennettii]